jgi:hypothetical protein
VAFFCFCRATIGRAKVRRVVYDHLTAPIRRISRFRHGAEVALKVPTQIGEAAPGMQMARVLSEISAYSCMAAFVTGIVVLGAATFIS